MYRKSLLLAALLTLVLAIGGCMLNVKRDASKTYQNVTIKQAATAAVAALRDDGFSLSSTQSPIEGMTVLVGKRPVSAWDNHQIEITVTITERAPFVDVEALANIQNAITDSGQLGPAMDSFYRKLEKRLGK